ncbi:CFI-box-CTERM domain-containing protein, partial [Desulfosporosinus sp.]|uniref:CFI-box-CTERM domain-containing protein n=1 Tax=Desulfosporosinus sp. TaxID=157907 RepID=UPI0025C36E61
KEITNFTFAGLDPDVTATIAGTNITATVPAGTSVTALVPTIAVSAKATVSPASGEAQDFTNPLTYTVTAENGTTKEYTVTVTVQPAVQGPSLLNVSLDATEKIVTLVFDKSLISNVTDLKSAITFAEDGSNFNALGANDTVAISSTDPKKLNVTFSSPLTGTDNKLQIAANSLKDSNGNVQTEVLTTPAITTGQVDECFIATAAFGSKNQSDVVLLRQFRDQFLLSNPLGKAFVETYYTYSPPIAQTIAGSVILKFVTRVLLLPLVVIVYMLFHPVLLVGVLSAITFMFVQRRKRKTGLSSR